MKKVLVGAVLALGLSGCLPMATVMPFAMSGVGALADKYCSPEAESFRRETRERIYKDGDFTIITWDDC